MIVVGVLAIVVFGFAPAKLLRQRFFNICDGGEGDYRFMVA